MHHHFFLKARKNYFIKVKMEPENSLGLSKDQMGAPGQLLVTAGKL